MLIVSSRQCEVFGLSFVPTIAPAYSDDAEELPGQLELHSGEDDNSPAALALVEAAVADASAVMEIGVGLYEPEKSFTPRLAGHGIYLGVDPARATLRVNSPRAYLLRCSSFEQGRVRDRLKSLGVTSLDVLMIDGCHSVNACVNDWRYAELVRVGGTVLIHDTNSHPGPVALAAAIDQDVFSVAEPLRASRDYGLTICRRLR